MVDMFFKFVVGDELHLLGRWQHHRCAFADIACRLGCTLHCLDCAEATQQDRFILGKCVRNNLG